VEPLTAPDHDSALSRALLTVGGRPDDASRAAVYDALLQAVLLAPLDPASTEEKAVLLVERTAAGHVLPAFSSKQAFAQWGAVPTWLAVRAPELFRAALLQGIDAVRLDAAGPVKVTLGSWEVRRIAAGSAPTPHGSPDRDARSALGLPDPPLPTAFTAAIAARARSIAGIRAVAVFEGDPVRARRHLVLGIRAEPPLEPLIDALHDGLAPPDRALVNYLHLTGEDDPRFAGLERRATVYRS
jgi:hypothetical protein